MSIMLDRVKNSVAGLASKVAAKAAEVNDKVAKNAKKQEEAQYIVGLDIGTEFVKALIGKIEDDRIEVSCLLQPPAVPHEEPARGAEGGRDRDHERDSETEGVWTRDDQDGDHPLDGVRAGGTGHEPGGQRECAGT